MRDISFDVYVAGGPGKTYNESVTMKAGISLRGGYDATNGWARNISSFASTIVPLGDRGISAYSDITLAYQSSTIIEGMAISSDTTSSAVFGIVTVNSNIQIQNNKIDFANNSTGGIIAVSVTGANVIITGNSISSNAVYSAIGVKSLEANSAHISQNTFTLSSNNSLSYGVALSGGLNYQIQNNAMTLVGTNLVTGIDILGDVTALNVSSNLIFAKTTAMYNASGLIINTSNASTFTFQNNLVLSSSLQSSRSMVVGGQTTSATATIVNNTMASVGSGFSTTNIQIPFPTGPTTSVQSNILFNSGATLNSGIYEGFGANLADFTGNLLFDMSTGLYINNGNTGSPLTTQASLTYANTIAPAAGSCTGNLAPWDNAAGPNTASVFSAGFVAPTSVTTAADLKTWTIKGYVNATSGPADLDASGGWSTGDIGANAAAAGP